MNCKNSFSSGPYPLYFVNKNLNSTFGLRYNGQTLFRTKIVCLGRGNGSIICTIVSCTFSLVRNLIWISECPCFWMIFRKFLEINWYDLDELFNFGFSQNCNGCVWNLFVPKVSLYLLYFTLLIHFSSELVIYKKKLRCLCISLCISSIFVYKWYLFLGFV